MAKPSLLKGKSAPRERPYDEHLRSQIQELYPRQHRKLAVQLSATESVTLEAANYGNSNQRHGTAATILSSEQSSVGQALG